MSLLLKNMSDKLSDDVLSKIIIIDEIVFNENIKGKTKIDLILALKLQRIDNKNKAIALIKIRKKKAKKYGLYT